MAIENNRKILHLVMTPFTGVGLHGGYRGDEWCKGRIQVFKDFTLKSLQNQSNKNFIHWFSFRPEERNNQLIKDLHTYLTDLKYPFIFTFDGLMYHDDKFTKFTLRTITRNFLMMLWDCWRYKQLKNPLEILKYTFQNKNKTLLKRLKNSLRVLEKLPESDWVYLTRIDSDDMFHKEAIDMIQAAEPAYKKALMFDKGYVLNKQTGQVADWNPTSNPPFHTIIFPYATFFHAPSHLNYYGDYRSHESIPEVFEATKLPDDKYCYVINHGNISTYWNTKAYMVTTNETNMGTHWKTNRLRNWWIKKRNPNLQNIQRGIHPFIGQEYFGEEKESILKLFAI